MNDRLLTTSEVAAYCQVTNDGVVKWIKAKKLRAYSTPGGHYRIRKSDFREFLDRFGMPVDPNFFAEERKKVLIVDDQQNALEAVARALGGDASDFHIITARDGFEAGLKIGTCKPDLVIVDVMGAGGNGADVCRRVKTDPDTSNIRVVALMAAADQGGTDRAQKLGADLCLSRPQHLDQLKKEVTRLLEAAS